MAWPRVFHDQGRCRCGVEREWVGTGIKCQRDLEIELTFRDLLPVRGGCNCAIRFRSQVQPHGAKNNRADDEGQERSHQIYSSPPCSAVVMVSTFSRIMPR